MSVTSLPSSASPFSPPSASPSTRPASAPAPHADATQGDRVLQLRRGFAELGEVFCREVAPHGLPQPRLRLLSDDAARLLGVAPAQDDATRERWAQEFSGNLAAAHGGAVCTVYAGHQFGNWAGQLGDGRAHLLGEARSHDPAQDLGHAWWEVQLKGAGLTPFSRRGDGRAVLRSSLREFLCSEAMWHLGVPTTRALCLVDSDLPVRRETLESAAVVTRLSPSFVRFGHFEHFSYSGQHDALRQLLEHGIARACPHAADAANPALALLHEVVASTARLMAHWQCVGFVHGVMNTDNMSILGWTIDYGPFGFMDRFDPGYTPNTTDVYGRYAWSRQPGIARWNLLALAHALQPLIGDEQAGLDAVEAFADAFMPAMRDGMRAKLGLHGADAGASQDDDLIQDWLDLLAACRADWTLSHRLLAGVVAQPDAAPPAAFAQQFAAWPQRLHDWLVRLRQRLQGVDADARAARVQHMLRTNPCYVLRHHLAQHAIAQAQAGDFGAAQRLQRVLRTPYDEQPGCEDLAAAAPADAGPPVLSCSS